MLRLQGSGYTGRLTDHFRVCELMNPTLDAHYEDERLMQLMESSSSHTYRTILIKDRDDIPRGVVSITDLIIAYLHGVSSSASAKTIMSAPVRSCDYDEPLIVAVRKMIFYDLDNLYVHKERPANIVGVVTLADVARLRSGSCRACMISRIEMNP
jgi:predicted transcriptional regulator